MDLEKISIDSKIPLDELKELEQKLRTKYESIGGHNHRKPIFRIPL